ncbi:MAG TPA: hypothetical protein VKQ31_03900 [Steroidobacteraceae bacterium]|nr:hypothetical protein [Steroidobacteraceae bacterium]
MTENRKVSSLRELAQDIAPERDLWPQIESQLAASGSRAGGAVTPAGARAAVPAQLRWLALAAAVGCIAIGVWIGRSALPGGAQPPLASRSPAAEGAVPIAWVSDPRYRREHDALLKGLGAQLASLPPASRDKVVTSLAAIDKAKQELETALGKDPSNALLQELLVNTYQDEMRVLTDVHEAGNAGKGI